MIVCLFLEPGDIIHHHPVFVKDTSKYWYKPTISREEGMCSFRLNYLQVSLNINTWIDTYVRFAIGCAFHRTYHIDGVEIELDAYWVLLREWISVGRVAYVFMLLCFAAINMLRDKPPGTFVVRDSNSFPGAFGLALKVATPPPGIHSGRSFSYAFSIL